MKRFSYYVKPGNVESLRILEEEINDPKEEEIQVKVKCIGLNFADIFCLLGLYKAAPKNELIPGLEF